MIHIIAVGLGMANFSIKHLADNMLLFLVRGNWFFVSYLALYMLAPIMNAYIEKVETRQLGMDGAGILFFPDLVRMDFQELY